MSGRKTPLVTGEFYHIFNHGVGGAPIFTNKKEYQRAIMASKYYQFSSPTLKLSTFLTLSLNRKEELLGELINENKKYIDLVCYCLMPNHYHLLVRQVVDNGISIYMSNFQNSYARYFNTKNKRDGHLFRSRFKAVHVETEEQLVHLSRYIHLNPYSSYIAKTIDQALEYPWSSVGEFLDQDKGGFCQKDFILSRFTSVKHYRDFLVNRADYQRKLEEIKHLVLD